MAEDQKKSETFKVTDRRGQEKDESAKLSSEPLLDQKKESSSKNHEPHEPMDFSTFILSMSTSAAIHLGLIADPQTKKTNKNLDMARREIDILEILQDKTKGNVTTDEKRILEQVLYELRLHFVKASSS